jgi:homoserine O-acetyltransferase
LPLTRRFATACGRFINPAKDPSDDITDPASFLAMPGFFMSFIATPQFMHFDDALPLQSGGSIAITPCLRDLRPAQCRQEQCHVVCHALNASHHVAAATRASPRAKAGGTT